MVLQALMLSRVMGGLILMWANQAAVENVPQGFVAALATVKKEVNAEAKPNVNSAKKLGLHPATPGLDNTGTPPLPKAGGLPKQSATGGQTRPLPNYRSRAQQDLSAGEVLILIPRIVFYPVHLTLEYMVRWPLVQLISVSEEYRVIEHIVDFFTWADGKAGLFPTAFYEFGLSPSVGFYSFYEDLLVPNSKLILRGGFWENKQQVALEHRSRIFRDDSGTFFVTGRFSQRPDNPFYGLGSSGTENVRTNYRMVRVVGEMGLEGLISDLNRVRFWFAYQYLTMKDGLESPISERFDVNDPLSVPGWGSYHLVSAQLKVDLDTRSPHRDWTSGNGLRLEAFGSYHIDPLDPDLQFLRFGAELSGYWDVSGLNHVLGLRLYTAFVENLGDNPVPFIELTRVGGAEQLRGFLSGRFLGTSAVVLTFDYRYPIWAYLDGNLFASLGNVFDDYLEGFSTERLFLSWGLGFRNNNSRDVSFDFMLTFGSKRLDTSSFEIDRVGLTVGINQGF